MREVHAGGVRFNVMTLGERGPVVAMIHGLLLDNHASFYMTLAPALARRARVVLYDLRGHGRSEQPASDYGVDAMASDLAGILDGLGLGAEPVVLVGHSFGGHIALRFAARFPERVRGLVLLESQSGASELGTQMAETLRLEGDARRAKVRELFGAWLSRHAARGHVDPDKFDPDELDADARATVEKLSRLQRRRRSPMVAAAEYLREHTTFVDDLAATRPLDDGELARIGCPVLAAYGAESDLRGDGERLARLLPRCRLVLLPGCAHGILFQATAALREELNAWLDAEGL